MIERNQEPGVNLVQRTQCTAGKVKSRSIVTFLYVGLLLTLSANHNGLFAVAHGEDNTLYEALTCEEYDVETHTPADITNFFEITSPGAYFWFNISYVKDANISIVWFFPDGSIFSVDTWLTPDEELVKTLPWYDGISFMPVTGEAPSRITGKYRVELYLDDVLQIIHEFNVIDRESEDWGYRAEIVKVTSPSGSVDPREEFVVKVAVSYSFSELTVFTPGIWDPESEDLIEEDYDEVIGDGTKTYRFTIEAPSDVGTYTFDAVAFYLVDDEWFYDEDGLESFNVVVEVSNDGGWVIPGYPFEAIVVGFALSILVIYLGFTRQRTRMMI